MAANNCVSLAGSTVCAGFSGGASFSASAASAIGVSTAQQFDALVANNVHAKAVAIGSTTQNFVTDFACDWDESRVRYAATFFCAYFLHLYAGDCPASPEQISPSACSAFVTTAEQLITSTITCPPSTDPTIADARSLVTDNTRTDGFPVFCASIKDGALPTKGTGEGLACGFGARGGTDLQAGFTSAYTYCSTVGADDDCCTADATLAAAVAAKNPTLNATNPTINANSTTNAGNSTDGGGPSGQMCGSVQCAGIAAAVTGIIFGIASFVALFVFWPKTKEGAYGGGGSAWVPPPPVVDQNNSESSVGGSTFVPENAAAYSAPAPVDHSTPQFLTSQQQQQQQQQPAYPPHMSHPAYAHNAVSQSPYQTTSQDQQQQKQQQQQVYGHEPQQLQQQPAPPRLEIKAPSITEMRQQLRSYPKSNSPTPSTPLPTMHPEVVSHDAKLSTQLQRRPSSKAHDKMRATLSKTPQIPAPPQRKVYEAIYDHPSRQPGELSLRRGDRVRVVEELEDGWVVAAIKDGGGGSWKRGVVDGFILKQL